MSIVSAPISTRSRRPQTRTTASVSTGTPGYDASVDHAAAALPEIGFAVTTPEVSFTGFRELPGTRLEVGERTFDAPTSCTPSSTRQAAT